MSRRLDPINARLHAEVTRFLETGATDSDALSLAVATARTARTSALPRQRRTR